MINIFQRIAYTATEPNFIGRLVRSFFELLGGTGNYWLTVILFTLILKIATSPLDYWQKLTGKKNALKLERIKPQLEAVQKKYGEDKSALNMKQQELYKSVGYSPMGACLPMILTMAIMIYMFTGLNTFATYKQIQEFNDLQAEYYNAITVYVNDNDGVTPEAPQGYFARKGYTLTERLIITKTSDAVEAFNELYLADPVKTPGGDFPDYGEEGWWTAYNTEWSAFTTNMINNASTAVEKYYKDHKETFLWIKNIWRSDTFWTTPVPSADDFKGIAKPSNFDDLEYDNIMHEIENTAGKANGYLILPLLAMVLIFFSTKITSRNQQTGLPQTAQSQQQNKMMQWIMPIMMGVFGLMYTSAVALYMVMNSIYSMLLSFVINWLVKLKMKSIEAQTASRPGYRR